MHDFTKIAMFVVGAVVLFVATAGLYWEQYYAALAKEGVVVSGTVVRLEMQRGDGAQVTGAVAHLEFPLAPGRVVRSERALAPEFAQTLREGSRVAIRYLPQMPRLHEIVALSSANQDASLGRWLQYVLLLFIGAGVMFWVSDTARVTKPRLNLSLEDLGLEPDGHAKTK